MPKHGNFSQGKARDAKKSLVNLFKYLKTFMPLIISSVALIIISTIFRLVGPDKLGEIATIISNSFKTGIDFDMNAIMKIAFTLIVLYVIGFASTYIANILIGKVCFSMSKKLRSEIAEKINRVPLKYIDRTPYGNVLSIVTNDIDIVGQNLHESVSELVGAIVLFIGSLIMMFITNWIMALSAIASVLLGFVFMFIIIKNSQKHFISQQKNLGELNGIIEEIYSGQSIVKTYNAENEVNKVFDEVNEKLYSSAWKSQFLSGIMQPLMGFIGNFGYVVVCIVGAIMTMKGKIDFGVIVSFMVYVRYFTNPLSQIAQAMTSIQMTAAASERIFDVLGLEEVSDESNKHVEIPEIKGNVTISNVKFGYDEDREIIHNFSAFIKAGQKIAIVGPTGAGKTTIVNLLMRFYEINSGEILIDGISINDMTRAQLRNIFSMVLKDTWLFE